MQCSIFYVIEQLDNRAEFFSQITSLFSKQLLEGHNIVHPIKCKQTFTLNLENRPVCESPIHSPSNHLGSPSAPLQLINFNHLLHSLKDAHLQWWPPVIELEKVECPLVQYLVPYFICMQQLDIISLIGRVIKTKSKTRMTILSFAKYELGMLPTIPNMALDYRIRLKYLTTSS